MIRWLRLIEAIFTQSGILVLTLLVLAVTIGLVLQCAR
jgi:hypothetical protein